MQSALKKTAIQTYFPLSTLAVAVAVTLASQPSPAQEPGQTERAVLDEILVTAQKREESLQDVPISIQAFGPEQLEIKGITDIVELHTHVPNFAIAPHPTSSTDLRMFMRGVGNNDNQITQDPSVAIYLDGAYIARAQGLAMEVAEIARIEVLRGPQGTLYGRNATGGAINFITLKPDVQEFGFKQAVGFGNRNLRRSHTRLNLPIVANALAVQFSYLHSSKDGFIKNIGTGADHFGSRLRDALRFDTLWQPQADFEARYHYDRSDIKDTPTFIDAVGFVGRSARIPRSGDPAEPDLIRDDITADGHGLTLSWDVTETMNLKSITTYRELDSKTDRNFLTNVITPGMPLSGGNAITDQDQFSQEFQLTGDALGTSLTYVVGIYYFEESGKQTSSERDRNVVRRRTTADNEALAVYGQGTYTPPVLDNRFHVTAGARWSRDKREATFQERTDPLRRGRISFSNVSPTVVLTYDITDAANVYAKWARGYKSGGFNTRASTAERFSEGFEEERLDSFELGMKSQWFDNRMRLNAAAFYSDFRDIQINTRPDPTQPSITDVLNVGKAVIKGIEAELTAILTEGLTLNAAYGYLDPEYREFISLGVNIRDEVALVNAPKHKYTVDLSYRLPALPVGVLTANIGYTMQDEMHTSTSEPEFMVPRYGLLNARLTLSQIPLTQGNLRVSAWGKNLTDKEYYLTHFGLLVPVGIYGEPRSYGLDIIYEF